MSRPLLERKSDPNRQGTSPEKGLSATTGSERLVHVEDPLWFALHGIPSKVWASLVYCGRIEYMLTAMVI